MNSGFKIFLSILPFIALLNYNAFAQISPGDLSEVHSHLEGMSNCTQCHTLGSKVSNEKCLACHTEIQERLDLGKGYHSSSAIKGKTCVSCHNDHHGKTFEIVRFEKEKFDHKLAGYELVGAHAKKECTACHKKEFITSQKIKNKKNITYLGLGTSCTSCHADYHQNTLSATCTNCHGMDAFKPAKAFDHSKAKFQLAGKHITVECIKCHKMETREGKQFQKFSGITFSNCTSCHTDVHKDKFGQNCRQCHNEESFHTIVGMADFDHSKTNFKLEDKHQVVSCKLCHKTALTDPVKHERCADCHADYHNGQFTKEAITPDCSSCHSTKGFKGSSYTIEQHNTGNFPLEGAHVATPCFTCHLKTEKWNFRGIGIRCNDCHPDIHNTYIDPKYYPASNCKICHNTERWGIVSFDHASTGYTLAGGHTKPTCRECHFKTGPEGKPIQNFSALTPNCLECHNDKHAGQFEIEGVNDCSRCHVFENWKPSKFDHSTTRFALDGKHKNVACEKCHKPTQQGELTIVQYKLNEFKCETCHH